MGMIGHNSMAAPAVLLYKTVFAQQSIEEHVCGHYYGA